MTGSVGDDVQVTVPTVPGYTADKSIVTAHVNADGMITTKETIIYLGKGQKLMVNYVDVSGNLTGSEMLIGTSGGDISGRS